MSEFANKIIEASNTVSLGNSNWYGRNTIGSMFIDGDCVTFPDMGYPQEDYDKEFLAVTGVTRMEYVDGYGGEGCGDEYWKVWRFFNDKGEEALIQFCGSYASYDGSYYDRAIEVRPYTKTVTAYRKV